MLSLVNVREMRMMNEIPALMEPSSALTHFRIRLTVTDPLPSIGMRHLSLSIPTYSCRKVFPPSKALRLPKLKLSCMFRKGGHSVRRPRLLLFQHLYLPSLLFTTVTNFVRILQPRLLPVNWLRSALPVELPMETTRATTTLYSSLSVRPRLCRRNVQ